MHNPADLPVAERERRKYTNKSWVWEVWTLGWRNPGPWKLNVFIELNRELGSCMKLNKDGLSHTCKQEAGFMM